MNLRKSLYVIFFLLAGFYSYSQKNNTLNISGITDKPHPVKRNAEVSFSFNFPFNGFVKDISNMGIGAQYAWSKGRFGRKSSTPSKKFGFTFNAGLDYFFGKKDNYNVKYKATTYFHAYGGAIYNSCKRGNISLTAGPSLELYRGVSEFGFGISLSGNYYLPTCRNFGIAPTIILMKQANFDAVIAGGIRLTFAF